MNMSTVFIELEDVNLLMPLEYFLFKKNAKLSQFT